ncbi:MAG TPA: cbb3-type cytochrome c oxidase subunit II [Rhodopila sp.]|nr:cbb3-type cytochrome c oxidase subunit II [Rhodopila sp.]
MMIRHEFFEKNAIFLLLGALLTVAVGGIVEIAPLFTIETTVEHVQGMRPYSPLELRGRDIYVRAGRLRRHQYRKAAAMTGILHAIQRMSHYSVAIMTAVFVLIVVATYWQGRKKSIEQRGRIPFGNDV